MKALSNPRISTSALLMGAALLFTGCGGGGEDAGDGGSEATTGGGAPADVVDVTEELDLSGYDTDIPLVRYAWDPSVGDASVSAELGGPGFTGEGWTTNMEFQAMGSPDAVKGGRITMELPAWPATMRPEGKDWNTEFNYRARDLCQEGLLNIHPTTLEHIPWLATHWKISEDKRTYTFRINPAARWSDGNEVTSEDIVATYRLKMDERILMPSNTLVFGKMEEPVALSKYIVGVKVKTESWRNFIYFSGMGIMPAHQISIPGDEYLREYQNKYTAVSGPYTLDADSIEMNRSAILKRRSDWWDKDNPAWVGLWNIDEYKFTVITDRTLAFEKAKAGEIDYYVVPKAQWWAEELVPEKLDVIKRGLIQKRKFYNSAPTGISGLALNSTRPPLDDLRVRTALAHLRNREMMIDKLFYNEYEPMDSYWQYGDYRNPSNPMTRYDPFRAVELLEEAGWTEIDDDGYRVKDGKLLEFELSYRSELSEPSLTVFQEDCRKAGIQINLKRLDPAAYWKNVRQREYDIANQAWGALIFPNPETSFSSKLVKEVDNNNITAFGDARVDELLDEYDVEYDAARRGEIIREIDSIVFAAHPYVLDWYNPAQRVTYQNKFSMPEWGVWRTKDRTDMMYCWWVDPVKAKKLKQAKQDPSIVLETEPIEHRFWQAWEKAQGSSE